MVPMRITLSGRGDHARRCPAGRRCRPRRRRGSAWNRRSVGADHDNALVLLAHVPILPRSRKDATVTAPWRPNQPNVPGHGQPGYGPPGGPPPGYGPPPPGYGPGPRGPGGPGVPEVRTASRLRSGPGPDPTATADAPPAEERPEILLDRPRRCVPDLGGCAGVVYALYRSRAQGQRRGRERLPQGAPRPELRRRVHQALLERAQRRLEQRVRRLRASARSANRGVASYSIKSVNTNNTNGVVTRTPAAR